MGIWERLNNPDFNVTEFSNIKNGSGGNGFVWIEKTNAIGIIAKAGTGAEVKLLLIKILPLNLALG